MLKRRQFVEAILVAMAAGPSTASATDHTPLWQPRDPSLQAFMARAIELAEQGSERGDGTPYGAVVVKNNFIVGEGWNRSSVNHDATAHAETEAIRDAARRLGVRDLSDCQMFTNGGHPCPMCETAAYWARINKMWLQETGKPVVDGGAPKYGGC